MLGAFRVLHKCIDMYVKQGYTSSVNTRSENGCKDKKRTVYKEEENSGFSFILVVIDIFSKFVWMRPLKNKKGQSVNAAFQDILREGRHPTRKIIFYLLKHK